MPGDRERERAGESAWEAFLVGMRERVHVDARTRGKLERACELMWFDGEMAARRLAALVGVSPTTASKWSRQGRELGADGTRHVPAASRGGEGVSSEEATEKARALRDMTTEDQRWLYAGMNHALIERHQDDPDLLPKLLDAQGKLIPNLKAPEVRMEVQMVIGRGNQDRLFKDLGENVAFALEKSGVAEKLVEAVGRERLLALLLPSGGEVAEDESGGPERADG